MPPIVSALSAETVRLRCPIPVSQVINFVCPVRGSHTHALPVFNPTNQQCSIKPIIEGKQWSAAPYVTLEPLQNKTYEITYRPLTMTINEKKHQVHKHNLSFVCAMSCLTAHAWLVTPHPPFFFMFQGSVFFSFPDGTGMLYSLRGTADPPKAEDTIVHELPAKTPHTQLLPVHNWLPKQQRYNTCST